MLGYKNTLKSLTSRFTFPVLTTGQRVEQCYKGCPPGTPMELGCAPRNICKYGTIDSRRGTKSLVSGMNSNFLSYTDAQGNQAIYNPPKAITYGITWDDGKTGMSHNPTISRVVSRNGNVFKNAEEQRAHELHELQLARMNQELMPSSTKSAGYMGIPKIGWIAIIGVGVYYAYTKGMFK